MKTPAKAAIVITGLLSICLGFVLAAAPLAPITAYGESEREQTIESHEASSHESKLLDPEMLGATLERPVAHAAHQLNIKRLIMSLRSRVHEKTADARAHLSEQQLDAAMKTGSALALQAVEEFVGEPAHGTINVNGTKLEYVDTYRVTTAPEEGAGLWMGSDSTTDDSWGYFIGHNPGPFHCVMKLKENDPVTVKDTQGLSRTYHVVTAFTVPDTTFWEDIRDSVTNYGESVILQTCCGDNANYRVVVAV